MNHSRTKHRHGFTLVELLIVVLIIAILATITLGALAAAQEAGRQARTRAQIAKLNDALMTIWEDYRVRRVPVNTAGLSPTNAAMKKLDALREIMRMELPDRKSDVEDGPTTGILAYRPARSQAYLNRVTANGGSWSVEQQGAECLYMIMGKTQVGEKSALEYFRETEIGDVDGDGMPEILDAWGTPIRFLRWAPGFTADVANTTRQKKPSEAEHDEFDHLNVYGEPPATYYLYPLIMSAGPDREWDIGFANSDSSIFHYNATTPKNNPYGSSFGTPADTNADGTTDAVHDNIHNHFIATGS